MIQGEKEIRADERKKATDDVIKAVRECLEIHGTEHRRLVVDTARLLTLLDDLEKGGEG